MANGLGGFLVSTMIVATGLTGVWAWPILQDGGFQSLAVRMTDLYQRTELRFGPAIAALQSPPESPAARLDQFGSRPESLAPTLLSPVEQLTTEASEPVVSAYCADRDGRQDTAVIGDRIQLRIFESSILAAPPGPDGETASPTDIVFERLDLSGTYEVGTGGSVSLPALGHVDVAGYSLTCIESLVARAAFERMRTQNTVSAAFAARPPVIVRGAVRAPGMHAYSPGVTVERLLAQAGALDDRDPAAQVRLIALASRRAELDRTRVSLSVERMRVEAALRNLDVLPDDHPTIRAAAALFGEDRLASERSALAAEIEAEHLRQVRTEATLADLAARIDTAREQTKVADAQKTYYADRHELQSEMLQSGYITDSRLNDTVARTMDAERNLLEKQDLLLRLEAERRMAEHDAELMRVDRIKALTAELRRISAALDTTGSELGTVYAELTLLEDDDTHLTVTIERPVDAANIRRFTADIDTLVRPGDLVTVTAGEVGKRDLADAMHASSPAIIRSALKE